MIDLYNMDVVIDILKDSPSSMKNYDFIYKQCYQANVMSTVLKTIITNNPTLISQEQINEIQKEFIDSMKEEIKQAQKA